MSTQQNTSPRPKSRRIAVSTQEEIAKVYLDAKRKKQKISMQQIASRYNVTQNQVKWAIMQYRNGRFTGRRWRKRKLPDDDRPSDEILESQYQKALRKLDADEKDLTALEYISAIGELITYRKTLQQINLAGHIRSRDAEYISELVWYFEPEASNDRIIQILNEVRERCKVSR